MSVIRYKFRLSIPAHEYVRMYQGTVQWVYIDDVEGQSLQFPANALKPFVSHDGVYGLYELSIDATTNKLVELKKISS